MPHQQNLLIKQYVEQLQNDLNSINQHKFSIIYTGLTGSGKGTLIHYLTKNRRLFARKSDSGDIIIQLRPKINEKDQITISSKIQSDTLIPQQITFKGQVYRDLPGFMDNRDDQRLIPQDITNSFFIHEVFQKTHNVKIVFVSSKNSLNDKAIEFVLSLTQFSQRFENIYEVVKSIFLVVTKVPSHLEIKHIKFILQKIVCDLKNQIGQNARVILQEWISNGDAKIELFKVPDKEGPLNFNQVDNFHKKLKNIPYCPSPSIKNIISEYSMSKMNELQEKWNTAISQICYKLIRSNYQEYLKNIQKIRMLNTAKSSLNYLRHRLDQLMDTQDSQNFKNKLKKLPQFSVFNSKKDSSPSKYQQLMEQFDQYYEFLELFQKIHPNIHNTQKWKEPLYKIHHNISQIVSQPWQQIHGQDIFIKGFVVESAVVQKKINFYSPQTQGKIVIFAYFFIMNEDIVYPGGNFMIYAQYFIVEQRNSKIRLNGQNAKDYSVMIDDDNCHGQPGRPGQNAGNLLLKVYERCDNLQYFSVDLRGGRGGKGKNGGQIKLTQPKKSYINYLLQDKDLPTSEKKYLLYRQDYKFQQRNIISKIGEIFRILGTYNGQVVQFYSTQVDIQSNLSNFAYTLGGVGGKPGNSGSLHVDIGDKVVLVIDKPQPSTNGEAHVEVYEGLYVKQMIFPNFRQQGRQLNIKSMIEEKKFQMEYKKVQQEMRILCEKKKLRMRKMSSNSETVSSSPQQQKKENQNNPWTAEELKKMVIEAQNQIQEEEEISTPLLFKKKYKQETEYFDQDNVIREQENQEEDYGNDADSVKVKRTFNKNLMNSETKIGQQIKSFEFKQEDTTTDLKQTPINLLQRKKQKRNHLTFQSFPSRSTLFSYEESANQKSSKISKVSISDRTIKSISSSQLSGRIKTSRLLQPKKSNKLQAKNSETQEQSGSTFSISNSEILINKLRQEVPRWGKQVTKEVATDIGTGTFQKLAQRIINKVCQKALRTGFTMQKEVLKQFVENSLKSQTEKKLLAQLGILTGESFSRQIAKAAALKIEQNIITNLGKEVIRDTAGILQRQAFKHLGEDIAKVGLKRFGSQAAKEAQIQLAAKSLSSGTVYMQGMFQGLGKSILFQIFLSALLASGITDSWLIKPHFKSKKMDLKIYNQQNIQQPEPHYDFTVEEMKATEEQYRFFVSGFRQFHSVFANKT